MDILALEVSLCIGAAVGVSAYLRLLREAVRERIAERLLQIKEERA